MSTEQGLGQAGGHEGLDGEVIGSHISLLQGSMPSTLLSAQDMLLPKEVLLLQTPQGNALPEQVLPSLASVSPTHKMG